jgi:hypothetical protein
MESSQKLFRLMLLVYPREFRREFGPHMAQVFRDCCRAEERNNGSLGIWLLLLHTVADLVRNAPREHLENFGKDNSVMRNFGKDMLALLGCVAIIVAAMFLLSYGRNHQMSYMSIIGYSLDALVTAGIVGNFIVFVLVKATRLNPLRIAFWTLLAVNGALFIVAWIVSTRIEPQFPLGSVLLSYVVSFLFWFSLHWIWSKATGARPVSHEG